MTYVYKIICTLPLNLSKYSYKIRDHLECLISSSYQYNSIKHSQCRPSSVRISSRSFMFLTSDMASKTIHIIQTYCPFIQVRVEKQLNWC